MYGTLQNQNQNVTPVDQLMDLDTDYPQPQTRAIRNTIKNDPYDAYLQQQELPNNHYAGVSEAPQQSLNPGYPARLPGGTGINDSYHQSGLPYPQSQGPAPPLDPRPLVQQQKPHDLSKINCLEIAEHVQNCPICSKFYNTDKTIYIVSIVLLALICVILLKKILD